MFAGSDLHKIQNLSIDELQSRLNEAQDDQTQLTVLTALGWQYAITDVNKAEEYTAQAKHINERINNPMYTAHIMSNKARCLIYRSEYAQGLLKVDEAANLYEQQGDKTYRGGWLDIIRATAYMRSFDQIPAQEAAEQALAIGEVMQDHLVITTALTILGALAALYEDFDLARSWFKRCLVYYQAEDDLRNIGKIYNNIGRIYLNEARYDEALDMGQQALAAYEQAGFQRGEMYASYLLGEICIGLDRFEAAEVYLERALYLADKFHFAGLILNVRYTLARLKQQTGQIEAAIAAYHELLKLGPEDAETQVISDTHERLALCYEQLADYKQALLHLRSHSSIKDKLKNAEIEETIRKSQLKLETALAKKDAEEAKRRLEHADRLTSLGKLAAGIAHEINNPMQAIYINLLLLAKEHDSPALRRSIEEVERVTKLVAGMREMYQFEVREESLIDYSEMVSKVLMLVKKTLDTDRISVQTELENNLPLMKVSPTQIQQVIFNLILNARDAMPDGGTLTLRTRYDQQKNEIVLQVADTGDGISKEHQSRIFDPFFTTREHGSGLGLSICQNIIAHYGGTITVVSDLNKGTQLEVRCKADKEKHL